MIRYRYNASERFRIESINLIKKERERIINEEKKEKEMNNSSKNDIKRNTYSNMSKTHMTTNSKEKWVGTNTNEGDEVEAVFGPNGPYKLNFIRVNAQERFYEKLKGVEEPEKK